LPLAPAVVSETGPDANPIGGRHVVAEGGERDVLRSARADDEARGSLVLGRGSRQLIRLAPVERRLVGGVRGNRAAVGEGGRHGESGEGEQRGLYQPHTARLHSQWLPDRGGKGDRGRRLSRRTGPRSPGRSLR